MDSLLVTTGLTSFGLGAAMTLFAWSIVRQNRRREAARVALLSGLAFPDGAPAVSPAADVDLIASRAFASDEFPSESATPIAQGSAIDRTSANERATTSRCSSASRRNQAQRRGARSPLPRCASSWRLSSERTGGSITVAPGGARPPRRGTTAAPTATAPEPRVELLALDHARRPPDSSSPGGCAIRQTARRSTTSSRSWTCSTARAACSRPPARRSGAPNSMPASGRTFRSRRQRRRRSRGTASSFTPGNASPSRKSIFGPRGRRRDLSS